MSANDVKEALSKQDVLGLIEELKNASRKYYVEGEDSPLSDEEFDAKQKLLEDEASVAYPELFAEGTDGAAIIGGGDVLLGARLDDDKGDDVVHEVPMLSLGKAKKSEDLLAFVRRVRKAGAPSFRIQAKLDGIAISVLYDVNGGIKTISTRGNGTVGADITYIRNVPELDLHGIPSRIDADGNIVEVRGELFFTDSQFAAANEDRKAKSLPLFTVSRNAVAGIIKKAAFGLESRASLTFSAYGLLVNGAPENESRIRSYDKSFIPVDDLTKVQVSDALNLAGLVSDEDVERAIAAFGKVREGFSIPTDGVVIKPENEAEMLTIMGSTAHHPSSQIAWKYPAEKANSVIRNITFTVGKTGRITPVAEFDSVVLDGSNVSRASLHNFEMLQEKDVRIGSVVIIEKANEIIPQVVSVIGNNGGEKVNPPVSCPACGALLFVEGRNIFCKNTLCPSRSFESLAFAVGRDYLDIDRLSTATLRALYDAQIVTNIADLFELDEATLANVESDGRRVGEKTAAHIIEHIVKAKELPAVRILPSLSIPGIGRRASKQILSFFNNDFRMLRESSIETLEAIDGLGAVRAESLYEGLRLRNPLLDRLSEHIHSLTDVPEKVGTTANRNQQKSGGSSLSGLSFSISGTVPEPFENRNEMVEWIEQHDGTFHSSPRAGTSFFIGEQTSNSAKTKKALALGVPFISPKGFTHRFVNRS